ncbi:MAG: DUF58 domain-containing protein [Saprospiraceae bacterium]|nr:DUF58 domain-containing protein [Saprospiraceae bacterium]MBK9994744.1 DUF58 domain-containing protein [Saprospiraceae bacterium]
MNTQEVLKKVRKLEIKTKGLSKHLFSGAYHSVFKGRGMSFSEVREYAIGDDVRHIDWNVTARSGLAHVKVYEEERELTLVLAVDVSSSMRFGSVIQRKMDWVAEIAAVLSFSATQNHDKVGLVLFSDKVELYIPPKKGKQHILRIIRELLVDRPECMTTNYKIPLEYINSIISKRSICFIISDFFEPIPDTSLKILCKRHDVIGIQIQDPIEKKIAAIGILSVKDLESNKEFLIDTNQNEYSNSLEKQSTKMIEATRLQFSRANAEFLVIDDLSNYIKSLLRFFKMRQKR